MNFQIESPLPVAETISRLEALFQKRALSHASSSTSIASTQVPMLIWNWSGANYSKDNWFGVNPFLAASSIVIECTPNASGHTSMTVLVDTRRTNALHAILASGVGIQVIRGDLVGASVLSAGLSLHWAFTVYFVVRYLIPLEIRNALHGP